MRAFEAPASPLISRARNSARRFMQSAKKHIVKSMPCLPTTRRNWKKRCGNASTAVKKTGGPLRLQQSRPIHPSRSPDASGIRRNHASLTLVGSGSFPASHLECMAGTARLRPATFAARGLGGETRMGRSVDTAMIPAITWRPLV